jgi:DNA modification methylase
MKVETRKIDEIKVGERKRGLNKEKVQELAESISQIGLLQPIGIDKENNLVYGYHRLEACRRLGWEEIPVVVLGGRDKLEYELMEIDENLMRAELTEFERAKLLARRKEIYDQLHPETRKGYASLGNLKQFRNTEILHGQNFGTRGFVAEVSDELGISEKTIYEYLEIGQRITDEVGEMIRGTELEDRKKDLLAISKLEPKEQKYVVEKFLNERVSVKKAIQEVLVERRKKEMEKIKDQWGKGEFLLGDARVLVEKLEDNSVDVVITDPPYGIQFQSNRRKIANLITREIQNDDKQSALDLLDDVLSKLELKLKEDGHLYLFCTWKTYPEVRNVVEKYFRIKTVLMWVKEDVGGGTIGDLDWWGESYEMIIGAVKKNGKPRPLTGKRERNVLFFPRVSPLQLDHPAQKPSELIEFLIMKTTVEGELIVDPFAGVGTTLIAAKKLNRRFWGCEIDEVFWKIGVEKLCKMEN